MATEIIDLTGSPTHSPPPPPRSSVAPRMLDFGSGSGPVMPYWANNFNPNLRYPNLQHTLWQVSGQTYHPSQMTAATFQPTMHAGQVTTVLEPVPDSNAVLFPHGTRFREPWTPREHELFLMGLIKYGRGRWSKIARHFLWNKTPQQVQSYAASFFRHLPATYMYSFRRRNNTTQPASAANTITTRNINNRNLVAGSTSYNSMPVINANEAQTPQTLMLFPENPPLFLVAPCGEAGSSSNAITTSISAGGNGGEVDLELRLGYNRGDDS